MKRGYYPYGLENEMDLRLGQIIVQTLETDFVIDNYTFEVGGKNKKQTQIEKDGKSFVVKDDIEFGDLNVIPLWAFGLNY